MSLLRTLDRRTSAVSPTLFKTCYKSNNEKSRVFTTGAVARGMRPMLPESMDSFFITALARAGSCPEHARQISTLQNAVPFEKKHHKTRRKDNVGNTLQHRAYKSTSTQKLNREREQEQGRGRKGPIGRVRQFAEKELKALVDYYGIQLEEEGEQQPVEGDEPLVWNIGDDHQPLSQTPQDEAVAQELNRLLEDEETPHEHVFAAYKLLPAPGVAYLPSKTIRKMLHHLSVLERPTPKALHRFLSILEDLKNAHIHITHSEWTTAIYLAGRFMGSVGQDEVESAVYIWRDMKRAKVQPSRVTMNVLFDIAVKAGKYALAEKLLGEMGTRNISFHRHFRVSLIYYYGVLQNGNGVRRAYLDLIKAGDIVDTVVMNAVIAALIRAGEPAAAEQVYERMKRLAASKSNILPSNLPPYNMRLWRGRRQLGVYLTKTASALAKSGDAEALKELQEAAPIAPNSRTYGLLIRHYATTVGDMDRIIGLLREMGYNGVPVEGTIYIVIFHGFRIHGAVKYSGWTVSRLEQTWQEYLNAVRNGLDRTFISCMAVCSALQAFGKCTDGERVMKAWEEVRELWEPDDVETETVMKVMRKLVPRPQSAGGAFSWPGF